MIFHKLAAGLAELFASFVILAHILGLLRIKKRYNALIGLPLKNSITTEHDVLVVVR